MYYKSPVTYPRYILRLGLYLLLFGCSIWTHRLYASYNHKTVGECLKAMLGKSPSVEQECLKAIKKKDMANFYWLLKKLETTTQLSQEQAEAYAYLTNEANAADIYRWVCAHYLARDELSTCFQQCVKELLGEFHLLPDLPNNHDTLDTYLDGLAEELINRHAHVKRHFEYIIATAGELMPFQETFVQAAEKEFQKQFRAIKKLINSHPYFVYKTDPHTYSKIWNALKRIEQETNQFLAEARAQMATPANNKQTAERSNSLAYNSLVNLNYIFGMQPHHHYDNKLVSRKQFEATLHSCACDVCDIKSIAAANEASHQAGYSVLFTGYHTQKPPPDPVLPNYQRRAPSEGKETKWTQFVTKLGVLMAGGVTYTAMQKSKLEKTIGNYLPGGTKRGIHTHSAQSPQEAANRKPLSPADSSSRRKNLLTRSGLAGALTLVAAGVSYHLYKKYIAKEKPNMELSSSGRSSLPKNGLFFLLCLLLGGLLLVVFFSRKKTTST